jgi:hypothetical protein
MRRSIIATMLAAGASLAASGGSASAQVGVEVYVGPPAYGAYYDYPPYRGYAYGPSVYGYYSEPRHLRRPEDLRTGSRRWWRQMDRHGRGGHQK